MFFRKKKKIQAKYKAEVLYVIHGVPLEKFVEPSYSTNPLDYGLNPFGEKVDLGKINWDQCKSFLDSEDAIDFAYHCNLVSLFPLAYRNYNGKWERDKELEKKVYDIDW